MTEQLNYQQCVIKKSKDVYLFWLGAIGFLIHKLVVVSILVTTVVSIGFIVYTFYLNWGQITANLPQIPTIPWYVYAIGIIIATPAIYSAVWCFVKRNDEMVKTE
jgi:hypothetical protein